MPFKIFARGLAYSHGSIPTRIFSDDCDRPKRMAKLMVTENRASVTH